MSLAPSWMVLELSESELGASPLPFENKGIVGLPAGKAEQSCDPNSSFGLANHCGQI